MSQVEWVYAIADKVHYNEEREETGNHEPEIRSGMESQTPQVG